MKGSPQKSDAGGDYTPVFKFRQLKMCQPVSFFFKDFRIHFYYCLVRECDIYFHSV